MAVKSLLLLHVCYDITNMSDAETEGMCTRFELLA